MTLMIVACGVSQKQHSHKSDYLEKWKSQDSSELSLQFVDFVYCMERYMPFQLTMMNHGDDSALVCQFPNKSRCQVYSIDELVMSISNLDSAIRSLKRQECGGYHRSDTMTKLTVRLNKSIQQTFFFRKRDLGPYSYLSFIPRLE